MTDPSGEPAAGELVDDTEKVTRCSPLSGGQAALKAVAHCASDGFSALGGEVPFQ